MTATSNGKQLSLQAMAFASQLLPAIIGVASFMLLVRMVQPELLGQYLIYMAAVVLCEMIKSGGLQSALVMRLSGTTNEQQLQTIGSAYWLGAIFSLSLSLVLLALFATNMFAAGSGIQTFCGWYAVLGIITLPLHIAEADAVARQDMRFLLMLRIAQSCNALLVAAFAWMKGGALQDYASIHLLFNAALMFVVIAFGKTNPMHIMHKVKHEINALFKLIKYTVATLATTNLLKSADTFLIGGLMGPKAVAAYAIPLKLTELFEIPLRSLSTTAFPQLAAANNEGRKEAFTGAFVQYIAWAYILYIPALVIAFIMAPFLVTTIGGAQYANTAGIFRVFCLYGLLLPGDRMTGISLDALQKPNKNMLKVLCMATVNIVADIIAIAFTHRLEWVAFASALNAATGAIVGFYMFQKYVGVPYNKVASQCVEYCLAFFRRSTKTQAVS